MQILQPISDKKAPSPDWFPAGFLAIIWRNWEMVPKENIATAINCAPAELLPMAEALGLNVGAEPNPLWKKRGYLTIIRNNWHIASYEQIMTLCGLDEGELAFILKEDDFMWAKMGCFKPCVSDNFYRELTEDEKTKLKIFRESLEKYSEFKSSDNSFEFLDEFYKPKNQNSDFAPPAPKTGTRIAYSYFAVFGDPLADESLDPYPDALLERYASLGVNGVWLQGILYQLADFAFEPNLSKDKNKRIANLNALIARAAKYNIGVYLYLNEPRAMPKAFFEKYPQLKGEGEYDTSCLCTSRPEVQDYLYKATNQLFSEAPGLAGYIAITMSENLTNCYSRTAPDKIACDRCRSRAPAEVIAEVNNLLAKGAHDANPAAAAITWTWAWDNSWARDAIDMLCENQIVQCTSEEGLKTNVAGVEGSVLDYTISKPGPGEKSKSLWQHAKNRGLETSAKVQINNTWELSDIPYIPALELIFAHIQSLKALNIQNFQLCWTLGGYPSINMQLVEYILRTPNASTTDFLTEIFGADLGAMVYEAQKSFSEAFAEFPFHIQTAYIAPQNFGVSAPFYLQKTGYSATMIGYPYDDLDGWRAIYPADTYESQMNKVAGQMESSLEKFKKLENLNALLDEMIVFAKAASHKMQSVCNHIKFVRARDSKDRKKMLEAIDNERKTVTELIKLRRRDSRIGFEASNHYLYTKQNLLEKLANLDWCERHILGILKI